MESQCHPTTDIVRGVDESPYDLPLTPGPKTESLNPIQILGKIFGSRSILDRKVPTSLGYTEDSSEGRTRVRTFTSRMGTNGGRTLSPEKRRNVRYGVSVSHDPC